jgi:hypothetical protein
MSKRKAQPKKAAEVESEPPAPSNAELILAGQRRYLVELLEGQHREELMPVGGFGNLKEHIWLASQINLAAIALLDAIEQGKR